MLKYTWPVFAVGLVIGLVGCPGDDKCDSGDSACGGESGEGEGEGEGEVDPTFSSSWSSSGVTISIENGSGSYTLGMAETDPASPDPWTGEDCLDGYTLSTGEVLLYCHGLSSSGGALSSGGDPNALAEGSETVFTSALEDVITYAVWSDTSGECWTWGNDTSYYTGDAGCVAQ